MFTVGKRAGLLFFLMVPSLLKALEFEPFFQLGQGTREFSWAISGPHATPDIQSELAWKNLKTREAGIGLRMLHPLFETSARADLGQVFSGSVRDSDYGSSGRQDEYSHSLSDASGSEFQRILITTGPVIGSPKKLILLPQVGYLHAQETYRLRNGVSIIPDTGAIDGLNSFYKTRAAGFGGGLSVRFFPKKGVDVFEAGWQQFVLQYEADADWNLRVNEPAPEDRFRYFKHRGTGMQTLMWAQGEWKAAGFLTLFLRWEQTQMRVEHGLDTTRYLDGHVTEQSLNYVSSGHAVWLAGVRGHF